ncbi:MAG: hypothetical protein ACRENS_07670 [Candidatus Eiseniibacteriota bacterium]
MTSIPPLRPMPIAPLPRAASSRPAPESSAPVSASPLAPAAGQAPADSILTPEEREFFATKAALGPLTYRPRTNAAESTAPPTGQRIDVRG